MNETITAPDFNRGYPSGGAVIGPVWQATWEILLKARQPIDGGSLARVAIALADLPEGKTCSVDTAKSLYHNAARNGLLAKGEAVVQSRDVTTYVIPQSLR